MKETSMAAKKAAAKARKTRVWTDEQKEEAGRKRSQTVAIRRYLATLDGRPRNGVRLDPDKLRAKLDDVRAAIVDADPISRVKLVQQRLDLEAELQAAESQGDYDEVEAAFIENAWEWAEREGISYAALREVGVPVDVLGQAGITR